MDAVLARKTWRTLEPIHGAIYFVPEAREEYAALGIDDRMTGYFASRSAPMGAVAASVVIATFFNFDHGLVTRSMDGVWSRVTPEQMLEARVRVADRMIRRLAPDVIDTPEMVEASEIARTAALAACEHPEGRPLFAGHAALPWPSEPHLVLWHAQTLLREFRGDGHIAALAVEGLSGCEALVTHALDGQVPADLLQATRQRTDADWAAAFDSLLERGWIGPDHVFTELGQARRRWIEDRTDELSILPYAAIGVEGCDRLRSLVRPWSVAHAAALGR
jgi:hypothetical protein